VSFTAVDVALSFDAVGCTFGAGASSVQALRDVSFDVPRGTITTIIGSSGAGKSTLFRCAATLQRPTTGRVVIDGVDPFLVDERGLRLLRRRLGVVSQDLALLSSRTAAENVALPLELMGSPRFTRDARVRELLEWVGLSSCGERHPAQLSGGQRQRVAIARALATGPQVLLFDEPTSALDPDTTTSLLHTITRVRDDLGVTVVVVTHDMEVVRRIADDVVVLAHGTLLERGSASSVLHRRLQAVA
jgi:D-methionine transport system ATP-binding protein